VQNSSLNATHDPISTNGRRASLQARKQQLVREAIWDAAIDLFAQKGFNETTVDDIVEAAGVSRRSFFRYFGSKDDLITQRGTLAYETLFTEAIQSCPSTYSLLDVLKQTVLQVAQHSAAEPRTRKIMQISAKYPEARRALSHLAESHESVTAAFARKCTKNAKGRMTASLLAALTLSMLGATVHTWFETGEQDISKIVDQVFASLNELVCDTGAHSDQTASDERTKRTRR
jgi:AcrR family transcriptional regulator